MGSDARQLRGRLRELSACARSGSGWLVVTPCGYPSGVEDPVRMAGTSLTIGWRQFWNDLPFACTAFIDNDRAPSLLFVHAD
jgi:hypothetical protein